MVSRNTNERVPSEAEAKSLQRDLALFSQAASFNELLAWLAHEVNQPVAAILNNARVGVRLLERGAPKLNEELREICDDIVADGQRIAEMISTVRSKLQRSVAERESLQLNDLITEIIPVVRNDSRFGGVSIDLELASSLPPVRGDRLELQQVMLNLMANGLEATKAPESLGNLILRTRQVGREVVLDVVDSGTGILQQKPDSIFDPFVTTKADRLGIGLVVSRSIVIRHNGRLWGENNADCGATFHMALPVEGSLESVAAPVPYSGSKTENEPRSQGLTILIADDKESFRRAVSSIMRDLPGLKFVAEVGDGAEALEKAAELHPDLVLLDVGLPKINGVEAAVKIRVMAPNARLIFLTQHEAPDFVSAALRAGALGYVLKVDAGSELLQAAASVLRGEQYLSSGIRRCLPDGD